MRRKLLIKRGGLAEYLQWNAKRGCMVGRDAADDAYRYLFCECELEDGVTLRDLLLLMQRNIEVLDQVIPYFCRELVSEGLSDRPLRESSGGLEYLELRWHPYYSSQDKEIGGWAFPEFHGWGPARADYPGDETGICYSLMGSRMNELADVPLRLCQEVQIVDTAASGTAEPLLRAEKCAFTLGQILFGILWELSWFGPPQKRDKYTVDD